MVIKNIKHQCYLIGYDSSSKFVLLVGNFQYEERSSTKVISGKFSKTCESGIYIFLSYSLQIVSYVM